MVLQIENENENEEDCEREMADLFTQQGKQYSEARPSYPPELFQFIASKTPAHDLVWDVGTGNGQAAVSVSPSLHSVIDLWIQNTINWPGIAFVSFIFF